jgi:hypothetical protein
MASLTVQRMRGLGVSPTLGGAAAAGDTTDLDPKVKIKVVVGGTATTVTLTPVGPYVGTTPAKVFTSVSNFVIDEPTWLRPASPFRPTYGRLDITTSQQTGVTIGSYTIEGA